MLLLKNTIHCMFLIEAVYMQVASLNSGSTPVGATHSLVQQPNKALAIYSYMVRCSKDARD